MATKATISRSQAFSRFLPGALETIDGETLTIYAHEIAGADLDNVTRDYLREQLRTAIIGWQYCDQVLSSFLKQTQSPAFEFVTSVRLLGSTLSLVECRKCKAVWDAEKLNDRTVPVRCNRVGCRGRVRVVPFVEIHGCGEEKQLRIDGCADHGDDYIILDRSGAIQWRCGICQKAKRLFSGFCGSNCYYRLLNVSDPKLSVRRSRVPVGSSAVFQSQSIDILNPPVGDLGELFRDYRDVAPLLFIARYFGAFSIDFSDIRRLLKLLPEINEPRTVTPSADHLASIGGLETLTDDVRAQVQAIIMAEIAKASPLKAERALTELRDAIESMRSQYPDSVEGAPGFPAASEIRDLQLAETLAGAESIGTLSGRLIAKGGICLTRGTLLKNAHENLSSYGLRDIVLVPDFPVVGCAYGFTRGYAPRVAPRTQVLRAFPKRPSVTGGTVDRTPFYVVPGRTEALVIRLDPIRLVLCLEKNSLGPSNKEVWASEYSARSWIFKQFLSEVPSPTTHLIRAIVHSFSHRLLEQVSVESCFSAVSLSEMLLPAAASFVIYVNQRSEFNIGGLAAFVEQRLARALDASTSRASCMFDPICESKDGAACNGCLYLPEVTCRSFNQHLSRSTLYGGAIGGELALNTSRDRLFGFLQSD